MTRLLSRLKRHPREPETLSGLVQVLRFRGLLQESIQANKRAADLDPTIITSVPHTLFLAGEYAATIETYSGRASYYLDAAAWAALGDTQRARMLLRERVASMPLSGLMSGLMYSLLALLEDRADEAIDRMGSMQIVHEPEILVYLARHYSRMGTANAALDALKRAAESGFVCTPLTLAEDPWLAAVRKHREFAHVLANAETLVAQARTTLRGWTDQG